MKNIFYEVDKHAFFILSKAFEKERLTFKEIQEIILGLKHNLKQNPIPLTLEQLQKLEELGVIRKLTKQEYEDMRDGVKRL